MICEERVTIKLYFSDNLNDRIVVAGNFPSEMVSACNSFTAVGSFKQKVVWQRELQLLMSIVIQSSRKQ